MKLFSEFILNFCLFGLAYLMFEVLWSSIFYRPDKDKPIYRFVGKASCLMFFVGGIAGIVFYIMYYIFFIPMIFLMLIGCIVITAIELGSGMLLNVVLKLDLWDYSKYPINFKGQIELFHSIGWFMLTPTAVWIAKSVRGGIIDNWVYEYARIVLDFVK